MNTDRAKELRTNSTMAERTMWRVLHTFRTGGYHFRKQVPIGPYFADIACHHAKLVIEVDGDTHYTDEGEAHDRRRDAFLRSEGYNVLRFTNADVIENPNGVFLVVTAALEGRPKNHRKRPPLPSPPHKGEGEPTESSSLTATSRDSALAHTLPLVGRVGEGEGPRNNTSQKFRAS